MAGRNRTRTVRAHPSVGEVSLVKPGPFPSTALVASAVSVTGTVRQLYRGRTEWQADAWHFYDTVPELRFAANWIGNALSRCLLQPAEIKNGVAVASDNATIRESLDQLFAGEAGQAQMLSSLGVHLTVAGEAYLVGRHVQTDEGDALIWEIIGVNEMQVANGAWMIDYKDTGMERIQLTESDTVIRIWRPHPARRIEADSPVRALLPTLSEIESLSQHIFNQTISRLTGAGVWPVPDSVEFPGSDGVDNKAEGLVNLLGKTMLKAHENPEDPASLIPIIVTAPKEDIAAFGKVITFWSPFDEKAVEARRAAVLRFCVGMDIPPEVILGMTHGASSSGGTGTGASHWTAWQVEEAAIKMHIEPLLAILGNAIVVEYLRVITKNPAAALLYDTSKLKLQPDRSKEAMELADRGLISDRALLRELGMDPEAAASEEEYKRWLMQRIAGASATPEQVAAAVKYLSGIELPSESSGIPLPPGTNQPPAPSLEDHPHRGAPGEAALLMAAESQVLRALERAGNKLKNRGVKPPEGVAVPPYALHLYAGTINGDAKALLEGAWSTCDLVFEGHDPERMARVLDNYVLALLQSKKPHSRAALEQHLALL